MTGEAFDAETAAARVAGALLPLADAGRAAQAKAYLNSSAHTGNRRTRKEGSARGKDAIQRSFRLISANLKAHIPLRLTYR